MNTPVKPVPDDKEECPDQKVEQCPRENESKPDADHEPAESSPCQAPPDWFTG